MAKTKKTVKKVTKVTKAAKAVKARSARSVQAKLAVKAKTPVKAKSVTHVAPKSEKPATQKVASQVYGLTVTVVDVEGKAKGHMTLPAEVFGQKENKQLMAQAVRVYLANQREGSANTKTRGEVEGSTRKIYRQKGTGRARHGGIRAPIFVGGGITFGPQAHDFSMKMPEKMRRKAVCSSLSGQFTAGNVVIVDGLESLKPKTKEMATALTAAAGDNSLLLVVAKDAHTVVRSARNIENVDIMQSTQVNTYEVLAHKKIVFMKDAVQELKDVVAA